MGEPRCPSCNYRGSDAIARTYICLTQTPLIRSHVRFDMRIIGALGAALITIAISANNVLRKLNYFNRSIAKPYNTCIACG